MERASSGCIAGNSSPASVNPSVAQYKGSGLVVIWKIYLQRFVVYVLQYVYDLKWR